MDNLDKVHVDLNFKFINPKVVTVALYGISELTSCGLQAILVNFVQITLKKAFLKSLLRCVTDNGFSRNT